MRVDDENSQAVFRALASFGAPLAGLTPLDFCDGKSFYQMGFPPERVDVLQRIDGVDFDECWKSRIEVLINGTVMVPVISAEKLITNKLAAGRRRDLLDVEDIREAQLAAPVADAPMLKVVLSGWETGFQKIAFTKLLRKRVGYTLSEAKATRDSLLNGQAVTVAIATAEFDRVAFELRKVGVKSVTREIGSNQS